MRARDLITVVVPAFQAERTLVQTLASARAQTLRDIEIIVVDDGSRDRTAELAATIATEDPRVRLLSQPNAGVATARNTAIAAARGSWIAPLDADDLWHPQKLERQLAAATAAPRPPGFVYCWSRAIDNEDHVLADHGRQFFRGDVVAPLLASNFIYSASIPLLRRDAVERAGGFDDSLRARGTQGAEDLALWLAIADAEPVEVAPAFLVGYRLAPGSMSQDSSQMYQSLLFAIEDFAARRPEIPDALLRLGRLNAEMFVASRALAGGRHKEFLRRVARGLRVAPFEALRFLAAQTARRVELAALRARAPSQPVRFSDMTPEQSFATADGPWLDALRCTAARRAAGTWRTENLIED